jgi:hypothetical protein
MLADARARPDKRDEPNLTRFAGTWVVLLVDTEVDGYRLRRGGGDAR